jgi:hypothetical protein
MISDEEIDQIIELLDKVKTRTHEEYYLKEARSRIDELLECLE